MENKKSSAELELIKSATDFIKSVSEEYDVIELEGQLALKIKNDTKAVFLNTLFRKALDEFYTSQVVKTNTSLIV